MRRSPDVSPRRLSDISPQLRQLKYLGVDESIKEDLKSSRSFEDLNSASIGLTSIEERILRITGYYGYQPWTVSYTSESDLTICSVLSPKEGVDSILLRCNDFVERIICALVHTVISHLELIMVVLSVCSTWAASTQLAKLTFRNFDAPFTVTWFATNWNVLFFPLYYIGHTCTSVEKQSLLQRFRECSSFFSLDGLTGKVFFTRTAPFCVLWTLTNYLYLLALKKINTTDVSALFCCNKAFVFLLSWIVLRDKFMGVRVSDLHK
uniref:Solute carrier family 35 member F3 n=1 Tax=Callorhinchus milii TaxID=7868 RepID=A0A4W3K3H8_CALMI